MLAGAGWLYQRAGPLAERYRSFISSPLQGLEMLFASLYTIVFCTQLMLAKCLHIKLVCTYFSQKLFSSEERERICPGEL